MTEQLEFPWAPASAPTAERPGPAAPGPAAPSSEALPAAALRARDGHASAGRPAAPAPEEKAAAQAQARALEETLRRLSEMAVRLRVTDNRSTLMSLRYDPDGGPTRVSLHHMFLDAPPDVVHALSHWIKHPRGRKHLPLLDAFMRSQRHRVARRVPRALNLVTRGRHFDLGAMYADLNEHYFAGALDCPVTWGKMPPRGRRRTIRLGSYHPGDHVIRMHPQLDQDWVPRWFVRYILYHEMLHAKLGVEEGPDGRNAIHPPAFKKAEQAYPDYERAVEWLKEPRNLNRLMRPPRAAR